MTRRRAADLAIAAAIAVLATIGLRAYAVRTFEVDSTSMGGTLRPGDHVLAERLTYRVRDVRRGDLVVFHRPPGAPTGERELVKRVVALPGQRVSATDGRVSVDGTPLTEPYAERDCDLAQAPVNPLVVPPDHLYVLGDDRCGSLDSRQLGPIDASLLIGRIFGIVWPLDRTGRF